MKSPRRSVRWIDDRNNVADQPGGLIFLAGLTIALIAGLTFRGLIHPAKVRALVESAASRIHSDVKVEFDSARVSLASGIIPRLAVVIEKVRMESSNPCWMSPRLYADEIRLPVSLSGWLAGHTAFPRIEAGDVELRLTSARPTTCKGDSLASVEVPEETPSPASGVSLVKKTGQKPMLRSSGEIESLDIGRFVAIAEQGPFVGRLDLDQIRFLVRSTHPKVYQLDARTHLFRDPALGESLTTTNIHVEYKEFPERILDLRLTGNWREGAYNVTGRYLADADDARLSADVRHLPLGQVLLALNRAKLIESEFQPRLSWLSFRADTGGKLSEIASHGLSLTDLRLEGDLGEMQTRRIDVTSFKPLTVAPFRLEIRSLDFDRVLEFLRRPHPSPVLNRLGRFQGVGEFRDPDNFELTGEHTGLEFIFSNKGRRETQAVNRIEGAMTRAKGAWSLVMRRAEVEQGAFDGDAKLTADRDFRHIDLHLRSRALSLKPAVQQLMTRGGAIGAIEAQMHADWQAGLLTSLKGTMRLPELRLEGTTMNKISLQFDQRQGTIVVNPRIETLKMDAGSVAFAVVEPVATPAWRSGNGVTFSALNGEFRLKDLRDVHWARMGARVEAAGAQLSSEGGWDPEGRLSGKVLVREKQQNRSWKIEGTRDNPVLVEARP